jgi:hypothetical protein
LREDLAGMVESHRDAAAVRMPVQAMRTRLTIEQKPVARERSDDYAGSKVRGAP